METDPKNPSVDVAQTAEERESIIEELKRTSSEDEAPLETKGELSADETFEALQAQGLGAGALGTDPHAP